MINPNDITTVRVGELPIAAINPNAKFPFETDDEFLKQNTIQALIDYLSLQVNAIQYQIIDLWVTETYIEDNLDGTGLGINLLTGFAQCNGQNGTPNLDGQTSIGYGTNYPNIGGFGGSKDAVVVSHSHLAVSTGAVGGVFSSIRKFLGALKTTGVNLEYSLEGKEITPDTGETTTVGVSGTNKNMQPYIVLLKLMKL